MDWLKTNSIEDSTLIIVLHHEHYMLGAICKTQIFLFDSTWANKPPEAYVSVFKTLHKVAKCLSVVNQWNCSKWKNYVAYDCGIQENSTECGVHVLINALAIRSGFPLPPDETFRKKKRNRAWVCKLLLQEPKEKRTQTKIGNEVESIEFKDEEPEIDFTYFRSNKQYFQPLG